MQNAFDLLATLLGEALKDKAMANQIAQKERADQAAAAAEEERKQQLPAEAARAHQIIAATSEKLLDQGYDESGWLKVMTLTAKEIKFTDDGMGYDKIIIAETADAALLVNEFLRTAGLDVYVWPQSNNYGGQRSSNGLYNMMVTRRGS